MLIPRKRGTREPWLYVEVVLASGRRAKSYQFRRLEWIIRTSAKQNVEDKNSLGKDSFGPDEG